MKPAKILRTIEDKLGLKLGSMPKIKKNPEYLKDIDASGAVITDEEGVEILIRDEKDTKTLAEELTHLADKQSGECKRVRNYGSMFYDQVLGEALGYYGSKLVAPERKPIKIKSKILKKLLEKKDLEKKDWKKLKEAYTKKLSRDIRTWHEIGYDLGEKLYRHVQETGREEAAKRLVIKNREYETPFMTYKKILGQVTV